MKLWQKDITLNQAIEAYTVGEDYRLDLELLPYDCQASKAHVRMLAKIGILTPAELELLLHGLDQILALHQKGKFKIAPEDEDGHTAIENWLVQRVGTAGEKIHTGRSRNDQVLTALRLYTKARLTECKQATHKLLNSLVTVHQKYGQISFPGYTHTRKAMPSSVALWTGAFEAALTDDLELLAAALHLIDQNPLGTGAGYGVPLPLDRRMTTAELGFARVQKNPIYAQNSRGKFEGFVLNVLCQIMLDLNRMASDLIFFSLLELGYFELPEDFLTGSSIMPHKRNPDVLEILRGSYHELLACELQVRQSTVNLISGYHRDLQLTKAALLRGFGIALAALQIAGQVVQHLKVNPEQCAAALTAELYMTEKVYQLVEKGVPFREAYRQVSQAGGKK